MTHKEIWAEMPSFDQFKELLDGKEGMEFEDDEIWRSEYKRCIKWGLEFCNKYADSRIRWTECGHDFKEFWGYNECRKCKKTEDWNR
jgi:hypothetical protein